MAPVRCPKCGSLSSSPTECIHCGIVFSSYEKYVEHRKQRPTQADFAVDADEVRVERKITLYALPVTIAGIALAKVLWLPDIIFWYFFSIPIHEFGHAIAAWLSGRFALPLGAVIPMAGFTVVSPYRSGATEFLCAAFNALLIVAGMKTGRRFLALVGTGFAVLQLMLTYGMSEAAAVFWGSYGGIAGEMALGALLVISFFHELPDALYWRFFRFPALFAGAYSFVSSYLLWCRIALGRSEMPLGSMMNGRGDAGGDLNRLMTAAWPGASIWTAHDVVRSYVGLGSVCLAVIIAHYLYYAGRELARGDG